MHHPYGCKRDRTAIITQLFAILTGLVFEDLPSKNNPSTKPLSREERMRGSLIKSRPQY